eukprot:jgi/Ulvmu1/4221/UM019_0200.1
MASDAEAGKVSALLRAKSAATGLTTTAPSEALSAGVRSHGTGGTDTALSMSASVYNTADAAEEMTAVQQKERLMTELDGMRSREERFQGQFAVLPWTERRAGRASCNSCAAHALNSLSP